MALSKTMKMVVVGVIVGVLLILAVGLGVGLGVGQTKKGIWLEFAPQPPKGDKLIKVKGDYKNWSSVLDKFLLEYKVYTNDEARGTVVNCGFGQPPPPGMFCDVDMRSFGFCSTENNYNYHRSSPCVFLTLNKVLNWTPQPYNTTDSLPKAMPVHLKDYISTLNAEHRNQIWVSCEGENPADVEFMGPIELLPSPGFPAYYYPDRGVKGFLRPLVALRFMRPQSGIVINVKCVLWAKNIPVDHSQELGTVHFELMVD